MTDTPQGPGPGSVPDLECNLIMKGGITSGVIYPRLATELARTYRLRSIGGSSAGAIAAAGAAVAELRRVRDGEPDGYARLDALPDDMTATVPSGVSRLQSLFQPTPRTRPLFRVLMAVLDASLRQKRRAAERDGTARPEDEGCDDRDAQVEATALAEPEASALEPGVEPAPEPKKAPVGPLLLAAVGALVTSYPARAAMGIAVGAALVVLAVALGGGAVWVGVPAGVVIGLLVAALLVVLGAKGTLLRDVPANGFGLCSGRGGTDAEPALTDWLHGWLQGTAAQVAPVTFGDLAAHGIELKMMTTNLTQGRPMAMPWVGEGLFFDVREWEALFPADVVAWMVQHPPLPKDDMNADERGRWAAWLELVAAADLDGKKPLPAMAGLPIIVAVRMSLSFPLLISAIPLVGVDYGTDKEFHTNWFTDGGLCANLPVAFFDSPLPVRPTFAVDLLTTSRLVATPAEGSYLPTENGQGLSRRWNSWGTTDDGALGAFFGAMVDTWQGWVDNELLRLPGYRDRVVTIYTTAEEGGLNLNMGGCTVKRLAARGRVAGGKLSDKFTGPFRDDPRNNGFDNQRWIRLRTALRAQAEWLAAFDRDLTTPAPGGRPYQDLLAEGAVVPSYRDGRGAVREFVAKLRTAATGIDPKVASGAPATRTRLRLVPDDR